jgi:hypothetical protein
MKYVAHPLVVAVALGLVDREVLSTLDDDADVAANVDPSAVEPVGDEDVVDDDFETVYLG